MRHVQDALFGTPPLGNIVKNSQQMLRLAILVSNGELP
jgi:hypothetical protein